MAASSEHHGMLALTQGLTSLLTAMAACGQSMQMEPPAYTDPPQSQLDRLLPNASLRLSAQGTLTAPCQLGELKVVLSSKLALEADGSAANTRGRMSLLAWSSSKLWLYGLVRLLLQAPSLALRRTLE